MDITKSGEEMEAAKEFNDSSKIENDGIEPEKISVEFNLSRGSILEKGLPSKKEFMSGKSFCTERLADENTAKYPELMEKARVEYLAALEKETGDPKKEKAVAEGLSLLQELDEFDPNTSNIKHHLAKFDPDDLSTFQNLQIELKLAQFQYADALRTQLWRLSADEKFKDNSLLQDLKEGLDYFAKTKEKLQKKGKDRATADFNQNEFVAKIAEAVKLAQRPTEDKEAKLVRDIWVSDTISSLKTKVKRYPEIMAA